MEYPERPNSKSGIPGPLHACYGPLDCILKRSLQNDLTALDTLNNPEIQVEQIEPNRQKTYICPIIITLDPSDIIARQKLRIIDSVQMDTASRSNTCNLDTPKSPKYRKELKDEKAGIKKKLKKSKLVQK